MKKGLSVILTASLLFSAAITATPAAAAQTVAEATQYSYKITPLLQPFNSYFFVETDNPDPDSFRFFDAVTARSGSSSLSRDLNAFADIRYDDAETLRVNGGYIFSCDSNSFDGGEIMLQACVEQNPYWGTVTWEDTGKTFTLPRLVDVADYLIETYAAGDSYFDKMSAVQDGFQSICLYSGSYLRGTLEKTAEYWSAAATGHVDQSLYIYSPYTRRDSRPLFASAVYPFRYDSWGFPSVMIGVSNRLDSTATYQWNENYHYLVDFTCDGVTQSYGGAGSGEGQGIDEENVEYLTFGENGTQFTLSSALERLKRYAKLPVEDDVPRDGELTWKQIADTVGDGAWVRVRGGIGYTYLYEKGSGTNFYDDTFDPGHRLYWGGDLGYTKDIWVDGRYVDKWRHFVPGETFEDHPTSDLLFPEITVPQIEYDYRYEYNYDLNRYEKKYTVKSITEKPQRALFRYNSTAGRWIIDYYSVATDCAGYDETAELVALGLVEQQYLDKMTLTKEQVAALQVDKNTNALPPSGYIFDGTAPNGTPFGNLAGDVNGDGKVNINDATAIQSYLAELVYFNSNRRLVADVNRDGQVTIDDATQIQRYLAELIPAL